MISFCVHRSAMSNPLWPHGLQHARLPCPSPSPGACSKPMCIELVLPSNHLILCYSLLFLLSIFPSIRVISNELVLCIWVSQNIGVSTSSLVLPMNIQDWFPLGLTGLILESKGLSRIFFNITVQKHQFLGTQLPLWSNFHIHTWLLENHSFDYVDLCQQGNVSTF